MASLKLHYLFDPLCGWCYASAPTLGRLAQRFPEALEMCPTGLFSGEGARQISPAFANHASTNDQRIASLTGLPFSPAYFKQILQGTNVRFDSLPMTRALTAVRALDKALEPKLFHRLQAERYVGGLDTSSFEVVTRIATDLLNTETHAINEEAFLTLIKHGKQLAKETTYRMEEAQTLMHQAGASGVPLLLVQVDNTVHPLNGADLYTNPDRLVGKIEQLMTSAT